jgi:hypothetical protein
MEGLLHDPAARDGAWRSGRKACRVDDRQFRIAFAAALGDLLAVNVSGQPDVGDQHIRDVALAPVQRLFPVARVDDVVARVAQRFDNEFTDKGVVLDEKYAHWRLTWDNLTRVMNIVGKPSLIAAIRAT